MPAPTVMPWTDALVRVAEDGTTVGLIRDNELVVELAWVGTRGAPAEFEADGEVELTLSTPEGRVLQRQTVNGAWRSRWVLVREVNRPCAVEDRLRVRPARVQPLELGDGRPRCSPWLRRTRQGPSSGFGSSRAISKSSAPRPPPARPWTTWRLRAETNFAGPAAGHGARCRLVPDTGPLAGRLPPWLDDTQLDDGESWEADIADFGLTRRLRSPCIIWKDSSG